MNAPRMKRAAMKALVLVSLVAGFSTTKTALAVSPRLVANGVGCVYPPRQELQVARRPAGEQRAPKAAKMAAQYWQFKLQSARGATRARQVAAAPPDMRRLWNTGMLSAR